MSARIASGPPTSGLAGIVLSRILQALVVALIVGSVGFAMMESLPGDAAYRIAAGRFGYDSVTAAAADAVRQELGLDRAPIVRLLDWFGQILRFDLGNSLVTGEPISQAIGDQLASTIVLSVVALLIAMAISFPLGALAGLRPGGGVDRMTAFLCISVRSVPAFLLGVVLILIFAAELNWLPAAGHAHSTHLLLPGLTLGIILASVLLRVVRTAVADAAASESFQFARLKGLSQAQAFWRHAVPNAAVPVISYLGVQAALLFEGVVVVESVFAWPGIGHALTHAVFERDVPMLQGTALTLGLGFVLITLFVDLASRSIDPRSRT
ncbi:ABC transporter permease [Terrihabitans sp. B22-R8]|uniref:ABC transporter permease n=1 Tax=Terrihabitans sp. B22-R8 TaxID=3425128 RepID=UPI00403C3F0A